MNIIINIDKNTVENIQPKIYNIGSVITTLQNLLDNTTITITNYRPIVLEYTDIDLNVKQCFLNLQDYQKGNIYGLGKNITENDLISISGSGSSGSDTLQSVLDNGKTWEEGSNYYTFEPNFYEMYLEAEDGGFLYNYNFIGSTGGFGIENLIRDGDIDYFGQIDFGKNLVNRYVIGNHEYNNNTLQYNGLSFIVLNPSKGLGIESRLNTPDGYGESIAYLRTDNLTTERFFQFPDENGTLAITSDIQNALDEVVENTVTAFSGPVNLSVGSLLSYYTFNGTISTFVAPTIAGNIKKRIVIINQGSGNITLNSNGGDNDFFDGGVLTNTISITPGQSMSIYNNGINWTNLN